MPKISEKEYNFLKKYCFEENNKIIITPFENYMPKSKIDIRCNNCLNVYSMTINHLKKSYKCPECEMKKSKDFGRKTKEQFIKECIAIHGDKYDYSNVLYINTETKVKIKCIKHEQDFYMTPHHHLSGRGCKKCGYETVSEKRKDSKKVFIEKAEQKHENKYGYDSVVYQGCRKKIKIFCNNCNEYFEQVPYYHLGGNGCQKCLSKGYSKEEKQVVEWLKTVYSGEIVENSRSIIGPKELDIYIPEKRFAIEYNGLYWHSGDKIDKKAHLNKTLACKEKDIKLFHIFSDEWRDKSDIVKSMIKYRLGMVDRKVPARKCVIEVLDRKVGSQFFTDTHISGDNRASIYIGLKYGDEVVSVISLKKPIQKKYGNVLEIARFSNALNTTVQGGFGKLFSYVKEYAKQLGYTGILTYADRRFGDGDTYSKNGFFFLSSSPVDYWYSEGIDRYFRFKYRAQKPLSEKQVAEQNGVYPVYGCGSNTYIYRFCF